MRKILRYFVNYITGIILVLKLPGAACLSMVDFNVPAFPNRGEKVRLKCGFEIDKKTEELYTVKWYKFDGVGKMSNFYTYTHNNHITKKHKINGVKVVLRESNEYYVTVKQLKIDSSGTYKCEVTTKRSNSVYSQYYRQQGNPPRFNVIEEQSGMQVVELPKEPPVIGGKSRNYVQGDDLNLNCTSQPSYPPTTLTWYVNDQLAGDSLIDEAMMYKEDDLYITISFLKIRVQQNLFRYGEIRVKCVAEQAEEPIKASLLSGGEEFLLNIVKLPEAMKLSAEDIFHVPMFSGGQTRSSFFFLITCVISIVINQSIN